MREIMGKLKLIVNQEKTQICKVLLFLKLIYRQLVYAPAVPPGPENEQKGAVFIHRDVALYLQDMTFYLGFESNGHDIQAVLFHGGHFNHLPTPSD